MTEERPSLPIFKNRRLRRPLGLEGGDFLSLGRIGDGVFSHQPKTIVMAKNSTEAQVTVTLNGETARNELKKLEDELKKYEQAAADAYQAGDKALGDKMTKNAERLRKEFSVAKKEMKDFGDFMKSLNSKTLNELKSAAKQLERQIRNLTPASEDYIKKSEQLRQVNTRIKELQVSFKGLVEEEKRATFSLKGLADGFNKYFGMVTAGIAAVTGVSMAFRKAAEDAATLDDVYADVMKTTGLLHEQVADLDKELMKIDTRTSREQLLLLARDAGKLGITGKEDILGFVRAADQIQVALGEDLGEGAIKNLGKIADVFGLTKEMGIEKSLLSIASAVNALGQASTASEAYLVDFTQRLAGVGAMAGLSVQDILGFASGLDQSAMKVEMAATAFQKFLMKMYEEPAKFAGYAGMEVEAFTELLKTNANEAITVVMKAMNGQDGFAAMVPIFNEMGLDGARAVGVLSAMTKNLDAVTEAQALANVEFAKATSVTEEYNTKNNNLQANLEKARKEFHNASIELGQSLNPIMLKSTKIVTYLIKLLATHGKEIRNAAIAVAALTALIKAQAIADAIRTNGLKAWNIVSKTAEFLSNKLYASYYRLTGQTLKYAAAQKAANAAASKSVYGLIAIAVGALVYKLTELNNKMEENVEVTEKAQTTEERIAETYAEEKGKIDALNKIINDNNISLDKRKAALLELKDIVPGYHADLTEEGVLINNNTAALDAYLIKLRQKIKLEAYKEDFKEAEKAIMDYQKKLDEAEQKKQEMIEANGGEEPVKQEIVKTHHEFPLLESMGIVSPTEFRTPVTSQEQLDLENALNVGRPKLEGFSDEFKIENTDYGQLLEDIETFKNGIAELTQVQDDLMQRVGLTMEAEKTEMQNEIDLVQKEYEIELAKARKIEDQEEMKAEMKRLKEEKDLAIANIKEKYTAVTQTEATQNTNLSQAQFDFLKERYDNLTKKEKAMVDKGYASLSEEESKALKAKYVKLTKVVANEENKRYQEELKALEAGQRSEENALKQSLLNQEISQAEFNAKMNLLTMKYLQKRIETAKKYGQDETKYVSQLLDEELKLIGDGMEEMSETMSYMPTTPKSGEIVDPQANEEFWKKIYEKRDDIVASIQEKSLKTEFDTEMMWIEKLHQKKLLSEEEFEKAKLQTKLKYAQQYAEQANSIANQVSNFVNSLKEYETQKAEAEYQAQLTAAGDNAEQREAVEAAYEQKKLDIQKKYADTEMVINIAKTVAAGALAAIQAFAQLGPIGGAIAAALIAVTTAMEVATIIQQRNAIKNASVNSSGSSSASKTGNRTMTGYAEGGYTEDHTTVTTVGEKGREWVAPHWMVRSNPVTFANLERYRKAGSHGRSGSVSRGFADGGFTEAGGKGTASVPSFTTADLEAAVEAAIVRSMANGAIRAYLVRKDLTELDAQTNRFKNQTSR